MAVSKTLLTETEVLELARVSKNIPPCSLNEIRQVEKVAARQCLGWDFYNALVADLEDYSEIPEWDGSETPEGEVRLYKGTYYLASTTTEAEPTVKTDWTLAPKFETDHFNDLWCEVLGRYLALLVMQNSLPVLSTPPSAQGTVKLEGQGYKAAEEKEVLRLQTWLASQVATAFENLDEYLKDETDEERFEAFTDYLGNQESDCCTCPTSTSPCGAAYGTEFLGNGMVCTAEPETLCGSTCTCPDCVKRAQGKANRYVIA